MKLNLVHLNYAVGGATQKDASKPKPCTAVIHALTSKLSAASKHSNNYVDDCFVELSKHFVCSSYHNMKGYCCLTFKN